MSILRRDDTVVNTLGNAVAGASVYYLGQPADTTTLTPLLAVYSDTLGTPASNPQTTDGTGHAVAYLSVVSLFTVVYIYPNGSQVVYADQSIGGSGGGTLTPFAGVPSGVIDGTNRTFTMMNGANPLMALPTSSTVWLNFPLILGLGYTLSLGGGPVQITYANAPQPAVGSVPADALYDQGFL